MGGAGTTGIADLVRSATVEVHGAPHPRTGETFRGSGFFVAPGRVLTCAHVVLDREPLSVRWPSGRAGVSAWVSDPPMRPAGGQVPWPDSAVLDVDAADHPVVPLAGPGARPALNDPMQVFGFSRLRTGEVEGDGASVGFGDLAAEPAFYRLTGALMSAGLSGGPVLHLPTFAVVGVAKSALGAEVGLGGYCIPIDAALAVSDPAGIRTANAGALADESLPPLRARQAHLGRLPDLLRALLDARAVSAIAAQLGRDGVDRPVTVADEDLAEWVARQLLARSLDEVVGTLFPVRSTLGEALHEVLEILACCVAARRGTSAWVPSEAATALQREWETARPRIVRICSDKQRTVHLVLRRALQQEVRVENGLPVSAEVRDDGLSAQLVRDVEEWMCRTLDCTPEEWASQKDQLLTLEWVRSAAYRLDAAALMDPAQLAALRAAFAGLRFLVASRGILVPPDAERDVLDLRPPVDIAMEIVALGIINTFTRSLAA